MTNIGPDAFSYYTRLGTVIIPDTVTSIGAGAFEDFVALTNITIPDSVVNIGTNGRIAGTVRI